MNNQGTAIETFTMILNDRKMWLAAKKVGTALILELPFHMTSQAGLKYQTFGKKWIKPDIRVMANARIERVKKNLWTVTVQKSFAQATKELLFENYRHVEG